MAEVGRDSRAAKGVVVAVLVVAKLSAAGCAPPCERGLFAWTDDGRAIEPWEIKGSGYELAFGGEVLLSVCPGTWEGTLHVVGEDGRLTIEPEGGGVAVLDAGGAPGVLQATGTGTLALRGLTLRGGVASREPEGRTCGGALYTALGTTLLDAVTLEDNHAWMGGAICPGEDSAIQIQDSLVVRNTSGGGGGVVLAVPGVTLESRATSWGVGDDDNTPDDVVLFGEHLDLIGEYSYGDDADFMCDYDAGGCE
ncbi:MAG: hypothetical protein Q8P41_28590 [Pseudomonadota bacterium]|nr:hypothetical protein [Pseudomonadota bacterium]